MKLTFLLPGLAAAALLWPAANTQAQEVLPCGTDEMRRQLIEANPDLLRLEAEYELGLQEYLQARAGLRDGEDDTLFVIPVVFHVLYNPLSGSDAHNISDAQIQNAVDILNRDYAKLNADTTEICCGYQALNAKTRIRFQLATKDPFGNCTNGIDRITSLRSQQGTDFSKLNPWFRERYLNIWVVESLASMGSFQPAGYSNLPANVQDAVGSLRDGIIILHSYVGNIGTGNDFRSSALTHEVGHYLNLPHTWGAGNDPTVACGDDGVEDTPITKGHNSCGPKDLYDSFCSLQPMGAQYNFQDVTTGTGTTDPTPAPEAQHDEYPTVGLQFTPFSATGVAGNPSNDASFSFAGWDTGAHEGDTDYAQLTGSLNTGKYYSFTITPEERTSMRFSGLTLRIARSASGPRTFSVRSSVNNYNTNLTATVTGITNTSVIGVIQSGILFFKQDTTGGVYTVTINTPTGPTEGYTNMPGPITFRIYAWNAEDGDGSFDLNQVDVNGQFGVIENTQNYMEYSYCETEMFTWGQKDRMEAALNSNVSGRRNMWQDANHVFTGVAGNEVACKPQSDFYTFDQFVCPGTPVQFKANPKRANADWFAWTFEGGNPATSDQRNPTVTYDEPGRHAVTLTVGNDQGSSTYTKWDAVYIGTNYSEVNTPLQEGFNSLQDFDRWPKVNVENNQSSWQWSNTVGHNAPGSAKLNASQTYTLIQDALSAQPFRDVDVLYTPSLAMNFMQNITVDFWYAASTQTADADDILENLKVYASFNCGKTWFLQETLTGAELVSAGVRSPGYVPQPNEWRQATFSMSNTYARDHVRLKFEYTSGRYSNDLYLDDINISGTNVGVEELAQHGFLGLMPNPASNSLSVQLDLAGTAKGTLSFLDMTGRTVHAQEVRQGTSQLELDLAGMGLTSGVYLVRLEHGKGQRTERLVVR